MKKINNNPADAFSRVMAAVLPLFTIGFLGNDVVLYTAAAIGIIAFMGFIACLTVVKAETPRFCRIVDSILSLPYALALSALIIMSRGIDATIVLWAALFLSIAIIIANVVAKN